jgi:hypothetical protein
MPRRKPTLSTSSGNLRQSIASAAARLMAEEGIEDHGFAKRKAARQLGVSSGEALPTNLEIDAELRAYLALFQDEESTERLLELRKAALEVMEWLAEFRPMLTGAVLDGTAGRHSGIEIDLFADSAKDVEIMLLSSNISYDTADIRHPTPDSPETRLRLDHEGIPVTLSIYPIDARRRKPRDPHSGRARSRGSIETVSELVHGEPILDKL